MRYEFGVLVETQKRHLPLYDRELDYRGGNQKALAQMIEAAARGALQERNFETPAKGSKK